MSEAKHTPLPWFAGLASVRGVGNEFVADCDDHTPYHLSPTCTANAALIVRAVNAHADLLAACEKAEAFVKYALEFWDWRNFPNLEESAQLLATQLREAKAKATGA